MWFVYLRFMTCYGKPQKQINHQPNSAQTPGSRECLCYVIYRSIYAPWLHVIEMDRFDPPNTERFVTLESVMNLHYYTVESSYLSLLSVLHSLCQMWKFCVSHLVWQVLKTWFPLSPDDKIPWLFTDLFPDQIPQCCVNIYHSSICNVWCHNVL